LPIYEYRCTSCGHTLEALQRLSDPPLTGCPRCDGALEKLISRTAFQLKGGGWYSEGYGGGKPAAASGEGSSTSESSGGTKDAKPEGKKAAAGGCGSGSCGCH
jgi:putative FmdB family regulatory protein